MAEEGVMKVGDLIQHDYRHQLVGVIAKIHTHVGWAEVLWADGSHRMEVLKRLEVVCK